MVNLLLTYPKNSVNAKVFLYLGTQFYMYKFLRTKGKNILMTIFTTWIIQMTTGKKLSGLLGN